MAYGGRKHYNEATAENGVISQESSRFTLSIAMSRLTRDGTAEPVSLVQILRGERGPGNILVPCSADHMRDWQLTRRIHILPICVWINRVMLRTLLVVS